MRYLNAVGGGRVVKIQGDIAYVDEDGFETPVLARECVVVASPTAPAAPKNTAPAKNPTPTKDTTPAPTRLPVIETKTGDSLNIVLGFEACDLKALSTSDYEAYLVNDSNYYVFVTVAAKATADTEWKLYFDGLIEPNIQEFLFDLGKADLTAFDRLAVQYVPFKRDKLYATKTPGNIEFKVDTTKFAKFHCFRPNPYFDNPVIAFDIVANDRTPATVAFDPERLSEGMRQKAADVKASAPKAPKTPQQRGDDPIVVDLHASSLFESTDGLEPADILNYQVDRFAQVMDANIKRPGTRIVFIHGKGEGVLRQALMKELTHRYKGHDVQDASFREYGYGATQVTIRNAGHAPNPPTTKKKRR